VRRCSVAKGKFNNLLKARDRDDTGSRGAHGERTRAASVGKRSDDDYRQVSAYIRKDTHQRVKIALLQEEQEFSELIEELLSGWLQTRT
jgi:hypothetical protein